METLCVDLAPIGRKLLARGKAVSRKFFNRNICFGCSVVIGLIAGKKMGGQKDGRAKRWEGKKMGGQKDGWAKRWVGKKMGGQKDGEAENSKGGAAQRFWEASSWTCSGVSSPR